MKLKRDYIEYKGEFLCSIDKNRYGYFTTRLPIFCKEINQSTHVLLTSDTKKGLLELSKEYKVYNN